MKKLRGHCGLLWFVLLIPYCTSIGTLALRWRHTRNAVENLHGSKGIDAPWFGDEIDLDTIEGIEQVTKLVLIKTDSLPGDSADGIDGRYLNSLMETLYTGLRKPFKSVSADILGIFPTFEEIQVRCEKPMRNDNIDRIKRQSSDSINNRLNDNTTYPSDTDDMGQYYKSSLQVCQAFTSDCLSMDNLVKVLPPSANTFDKALVRLCPIMLFRIMNQLCHKSINPLNTRPESELISGQRSSKVQGEVESSTIKSNVNNSISLNTLLRETQLLKNLQNSDDLGSKKPQKLHKKLKTQTVYSSNGRINSGSIQPHGNVDEQLLKIRLKLTEPSIEKVWIFSLLFVILSIVVSMGGLIVLPFVKKTTRRRILTLFEGLAVGGLSGSATLHMFPQAFGLVDENYHKYFWRIFVVFFGIYLCYLCERIIKIVKEMRAKMRRSRASLIDMDYSYGFPSVSREVIGDGSRTNKIFNPSFELGSNRVAKMKKVWSKSNSKNSNEGNFYDNTEPDYLDDRSMKTVGKISDKNSTRKKMNKSKSRKSPDSDKRRLKSGRNTKEQEDEALSGNNGTDMDSISLNAVQSVEARQRLIRCLKYVQKQFSPVHAVQTHIPEDQVINEDYNSSRFMRVNSTLPESTRKLRKGIYPPLSAKKNRLLGSNSLLSKIPLGRKVSADRRLKQHEIETMLYHRGMSHRHGLREGSRIERGYLQPRSTGVSDVAAGRQDQDNAVRMSVDTVAWMIVFGDAVLNVIDGLSIGAAFERNILAGISISVAVMLEEVTHRLGTFAVLIRAGMSMQQSLLCTFLSACALFPGLVVGILLSDATEDATPYIFCAAGGIFLYMALVDVMKEMNRSIENAIRKDIKSTLQIFALQNVGIILAVVFLSFLALYEQAMDFEGYQIQYNQPS